MASDRNWIEDYDTWDIALAENPWPAYAEALNHGEPFWSDHHGGYWVVSRYADVEAIARDVATFSNVGMMVPDVYEPSMPLRPTECDPPEHKAVRSLVKDPFTPASVQQLEPLTRAITNDLIDSFVTEGRCDLAQDLAQPLPCRVIAHILGIPSDGLGELFDAAFHIVPQTLAGGPPDEPSADLASYAQRLIARRSTCPGDGLVGELLRMNPEGRSLTESELIGYLIVLVSGGQDTTASLIAHALIHLARSSSDREMLIADPTAIPGAVEEFLRWESPIHMNVRTATRDAEISGVTIRAGEKVLISWGAANVDPLRFTSPGEVDLHRTPNHHMAFGFGIHRCLGLHLARLEARIALEEFLRRIPDFEIASAKDIVYYNLGGMVRGVWSVPASFPPSPDDLRSHFMDAV